MLNNNNSKPFTASEESGYRTSWSAVQTLDKLKTQQKSQPRTKMSQDCWTALSYIRQEWTNIPLTKVHQLVYIVPRCLWDGPVLNFETCRCVIYECVNHRRKINTLGVALECVHFVILKIYYVFYVVLSIKYRFIFAYQCKYILFLFIFYTVSQLFWIQSFM